MLRFISNRGKVLIVLYLIVQSYCPQEIDEHGFTKADNRKLPSMLLSKAESHRIKCTNVSQTNSTCFNRITLNKSQPDSLLNWTKTEEFFANINEKLRSEEEDLKKIIDKVNTIHGKYMYS